jgi:ubiquinone/menaquinone biosynthesis C-methylase UbiE
VSMKNKIVFNNITNIINKNDKQLLQYRSCPICKNDDSKTILKIDNFQFFSDSKQAKQVDINQKQCKSCGAIYLNPCYSNEGFGILFAEAGQSYGSSEGRPNEQVNWLNKYNLLEDGSTVLDVGCGTGDFLASLPNNLSKLGVDIDAPSVNIAKNKYQDIKFICSSFENLEYNDKIDTITMYHVLEHLPNPLETLQRLYTLSDKTTKLVVEVPIIENGHTNDINGFFSVQHLTHFSCSSLKNILSLSGWNILEWLEQEDYNGCRVLLQKQNILDNIIFNNTEYLNAYQYLSSWYKSVENVEKKLCQLDTNKCIIWGGGMHLEFLYQMTSLFTKDIEYIIVDSDKNKQNKTWRGISIYNPEILKNIDKNIPLIISSYGGQDSIKNAALRLGINKTNIITLYDNLRIY